MVTRGEGGTGKWWRHRHGDGDGERDGVDGDVDGDGGDGDGDIDGDGDGDGNCNGCVHNFGAKNFQLLMEAELTPFRCVDGSCTKQLGARDLKRFSTMYGCLCFCFPVKYDCISEVAISAWQPLAAAFELNPVHYYVMHFVYIIWCINSFFSGTSGATDVQRALW